jgi:hypothetical protein
MVVPMIVILYCFNAVAAGPNVTIPLVVKVEPWLGQKKLFEEGT